MQKLGFFLICVSFFTNVFADTVKWSGTVSSKGVPSQNIELTLKHHYQIKVQGSVNLGKWHQNGKALASDACFEYAESVQPSRLEMLKNSLDISVCDGTYHGDHSYQSAPFEATQNRIHFWIFDTDYDDNIGDLNVKILEISDQKS